MDTKRMTAALCLAVALPVLAQQPMVEDEQPGRVTVKLDNVAQQIASAIYIDVDEVPLEVDVPIGIAAQVCDMRAEELAQRQRTGITECTAHHTNNALNQIVRRQT
jgi:hypothetical protein